MRTLASRINERTRWLDKERATISEQEFYNQIHRAKSKREIFAIKIQNVFGRSKDFSPNYTAHNLEEKAKLLTKATNDMI